MVYELGFMGWDKFWVKMIWGWIKGAFGFITIILTVEYSWVDRGLFVGSGILCMGLGYGIGPLDLIWDFGFELVQSLILLFQILAYEI